MIQDKIYTYFDGNDELRVLFIFDQMLQIESELEGASWREGYHYEVFDGRWFTTKYKIEHDWVDKKVVLLFPNMIEPSGDTAKDHPGHAQQGCSSARTSLFIFGTGTFAVLERHPHPQHHPLRSRYGKQEEGLLCKGFTEQS